MAFLLSETSLGTIWTFVWIVFAVVALRYVLKYGSREKHLPPGPPTVPILGNLIPQTGFYAKLKEWADEYGSVYSLKIGRSTIIVLNDRHALHELMSSHGSEYNDRPVDEQFLISLREENMAFVHDGPRWRSQRKIVASYLSPKNLDANLTAVQEAETSCLLYDLLVRPEQFRSCIKRMTASAGSIMMYGHRAPEWDDFWAYSVYVVMEKFSKAIETGSYLPVDQFPFLKLIPDSWCESRTRGKDFYRIMTDVWTESRRRVEERRSRGDKRESLIDRLLDQDIKYDGSLSDAQFNNFLGGIQMGAADTTATAILTTILFLGKHPEFQNKAQIELDALCGVERLPDWADFSSLPYINCIVKEGLRMRPVAPMAIPHRAKQDRWYNGMLIPGGSSIIVPVYALNHDSKHTADPSTYNPDRFFTHAHKTAPELAASPNFDERDHYSYGVGRRMCVGIHMAERTQWRVIAQILWAFRIERDVDENGTPIELDTSYANYDDGFLHTPLDFKVRFVPRSPAHAELIRRTYGEIEGFLRKWE